MGCYWKLTVGGLELMAGKSYLQPEIAALFAERDRPAVPRRGGGHRYAKHVYACSALHIVQRLEFFGFTLALAARAYRTGIRECIRSRDEYRDENDGNPFCADQARVRRILRTMRFDDWLLAVRNILSKGYSFIFHNEPIPSELTTHEALILFRGGSCGSDDLEHGFPLVDPRLLIRAFCEAASPASTVVLDFSELVSGGYISARSPHTLIARNSLAEQHVECSPVVVLTEGSTDARCIAAAFQLLYPHLGHLLTFPDFSGPHSPGGVGALANLLKGFAASQLPCRFVGLFDNDAAAHAAIRKLTKLPPNIRIMTLPNYSVLRRYPTVGPQGRERSNVNRRAASLELYMGRDVLKTKGRFIPVRWTAYERGISRYQGELAQNCQVQKRFLEKVRLASRTGDLKAGDWDGIRLVCDAMLAAASRTRLRGRKMREFLHPEP